MHIVIVFYKPHISAVVQIIAYTGGFSELSTLHDTEPSILGLKNM